MSVQNLYKMQSGASCNISTADGKLLHFVNGAFFTADAKIIKWLDEQIEAGEYGLYVDPEETTVDTEALTPELRLRRKIEAEFLAKYSNNPANKAAVSNPGNSVQGGLAASAGSMTAAASTVSVSEQVAIANTVKVDGESGDVVGSASKADILGSLKDKLTK